MIFDPALLDDCPQIPVSWGEILDKLSILEIKRSVVKCPQACLRIEDEYDLLIRVAGPVLNSRQDLTPLFSELRDINQSLWDVEDGIREKERLKDFGEGFVQLARSVYIFNDRRTAIKRAINMVTKSKVVEEKIYTKY
jgi:hypothetical protein